MGSIIDVYVKRGEEITYNQLEMKITSNEYIQQINDILNEQSVHARSILKCNLPYFMFKNMYDRAEELEDGFYTGNYLIGFSVNDCLETFDIRKENLLENAARIILQNIDRDEVSIDKLPEFDYPDKLEFYLNADPGSFSFYNEKKHFTEVFRIPVPLSVHASYTNDWRSDPELFEG